MKPKFIAPSPEDPEFLKTFLIDVMKQRPQWVCFNLIPNGDGKPKKIPVSATHPSRKASSTDPQTWGRFADAAAVLASGRCSAVGYALAGDLIGIDLDGPRWVKDERQATPAALALLKRCASYAEWSISRKGIHILLNGRLPGGGRKNGRAGVEVYQDERFLIVTGEQIDGTPAALTENQAAVDWLLATFFDDGRGNREIQATEKTEKTEDMTSVPSAISGVSVPSVGSVLSVEQVIARTQPTTIGMRNSCILDLARGLKFNAGLMNEPPGKLRPIAQRWHQTALGIIGTIEFDETWSDFLRAFKSAKLPLGPKLDALAFQRAQAAATPPEAMIYDSKPVRLLVGTCRELAAMMSGQFFLSCHRAGELLDVSHDKAMDWLNMLCADGVLLLLEKGNQRRANRYRFIPKGNP